MARMRTTPTCPYCGEVIAKGIYRNQSKIPFMLRVIGDTFLGWEYKKHSCKGLRNAKKELEKSLQNVKLPSFLKK